MAPVTTPGKRVKASKVDCQDPKQILKYRPSTQYQQFGEAGTMANEVGKMEKDIQDLTKQELLSALPDEGDRNCSSGKHLQASLSDSLTWKFDRRTQELLDAYHAKFVPEENLLADDVEHFCTCNGPDDGRPMIECSNGRACRMNWFHLDCIGMGLNEVPGEQEDWFCIRCVENRLGKLRKNAPKSISKSILKKSNADRIKHYEVVQQAAADATADDTAKKKRMSRIQRSNAKARHKQKQKTLTIRTIHSKLLDMSTPSLCTPKPWTAELDKAFTEDPEVADTYSLRSMASAKAALRLHGTNAATHISTTNAASADDDGDFKMSDVVSEPSGKRNKGSWTAEEKSHLVDCVTSSYNAGLRGEVLWSDVYPNMLARGVNRPLGGMRMTWLRELRQQVNIDERRRQNASKMRTAVQKSKKEKEAEKAIAQDVKRDDEEMQKEMDAADAAALAMMLIQPATPLACRSRLPFSCKVCLR